jgi:three-Cys-motif partner protein
MNDSDPKRWVYKAQTRVKHSILGQYLKKWLPKLGRSDNKTGKARTLHYVDGFAGRGKYEGGEIGSPLVALDILTSARDYLRLDTNIHIVTVELDPTNHAILATEVETALQQKSDRRLKVELEQGEFQTKSLEVLKRISQKEMTFVFIDPFGYDCIDMAFIESLLRLRKPETGRIYVELFINAMLQYISRFLTDVTKEQTWNRIFGTSTWRQLLEGNDEPTRQLERVVDFYTKQLQECAARVGLEAYIFPIGVKAEGSNQELYYLVHVSFEATGRHAMDDAAAGVAEVNIPQKEMFDEQTERDNIKAIIQLNPNITHDELLSRIWLAHPRYRLRTHIDPALKFLEKYNEIEVIAIPSRTRKGGFRETDQLKVR